MKKTFIILSLLLGSFYVQAQTKEETIAWIKEKFEKYIKPNPGITFTGVRGVGWLCFTDDATINVQVNECFITITLEQYLSNPYALGKLQNKWHTKITMTLPTEDVKSIGYYGLSYNLALVKVNGYVNNDYDDEKGNAQNTIRRKWNNETQYSSDFIKIENGEKDIYARIEKAIKHLNSFCPKKKEAF
jgi:hypothetical protein